MAIDKYIIETNTDAVNNKKYLEETHIEESPYDENLKTVKKNMSTKVTYHASALEDELLQESKYLDQAVNSLW